MGILDKLRTQPKWKHADPAVRLEGLQELDDTAQDTFTTLATDDGDAQVRRGAVARLTDLPGLASIVRNDADESVRDAAVARLVSLASRGDDGQGSLAAVQALGALGRTRELGTVARSEAAEPVRRAAVALVSEPRVLGGIARHAVDAGTRLLALEALSDQAELESVAVRGEHADTAVAAVERLADPTSEVLTGIAQRARSKAAVKKARAILREREAPAPAPVEEAPVEYKDADQQAARAVAATLEALAAERDMEAVREGYAAARVAWVELLADADIDPALVAEVEQRSDVVRDRLAAEAAARVEAERAAEARRREQAERIAVCERIEALSFDERTDQLAEAGATSEGMPPGADPAPATPTLADRLAEARATWEGMPPMPEAWAAELEQRFAAACRAAEKREERRRRAADLAERLPLIVPEIEALVEAEDYGAVRNQWYALRKQWQVMLRDLDVDEALQARYAAAAAVLEAREEVLREGKARQQQDNLTRLQADVLRLETRAAAEQLTLKDADQIVKDVKLLVGTMGPLPSKQDREDLTVRLQAVRTAIGPRIQEMRESEEWKRWANVQVQEELIAKMEALVATAEANPDEAAQEMRRLQERWKPVAAAPRSQGETLWTRFKAAQEQVYDKCKDYFAQQAAERGENLKKKEALVARAEALADSTDWIRTADAIKQLQAEWKDIGPVTRGHEKSVWERFRAACDRFFTRRQDDLKGRKNEWTANLARKEALAAEVESLVESTTWEATAQRIRQLQAEWKTIGPVKKSKSDAIWQRFRGACDAFYERYKNRDSAVLVGKLGDREAVVGEVEALVASASEADAPPDDLYAKVQAARARWAQGPELPRHVLAPLADRYNVALYTLVTKWPAAFSGTELDPAATLKKMEKLCAKVEALLPDVAAAPVEKLSPAEVLARQWREALAANTMGASAARQAEEARQRATEQEVRSAQAAWQRLGPIDPAARRPLQERFDRVVKKFFEHKRRHPSMVSR
jgi:hypothetical protein